MKINWQIVVKNLMLHLETEKIAAIAGTDERIIEGMYRGVMKEPKFNAGLQLLDLHIDLCPERHTELIIKKSKRKCKK